jgi:hypothetical protein
MAGPAAAMARPAPSLAPPHLAVTRDAPPRDSRLRRTGAGPAGRRGPGAAPGEVTSGAGSGGEA